MMKKKIALFFLMLFILLGNSSFYRPEQSDTQEYILKAAFIYRFTDYIEWNNNNEQNFTIAVLGTSGITDPLNDIARDKKAKNKSMYVKESQDIDNIGACQILFVSRNYTPGIETVISRIGNKPILIITEQNGACEKGAHINFLIADNKLKFEINQNAASNAGLKISSQLLQHAIIVNTP